LNCRLRIWAAILDFCRELADHVHIMARGEIVDENQARQRGIAGRILCGDGAQA
jgi:hypothetical protein